MVANWEAEVTWSENPHMARAAYNASNNTAATTGELSGMLSMVLYTDSQATPGEKPDWDLCKELAACGDPVWTGYSGVLASFAESFGGGKGGPELEEAVNFADPLGPTKQFGEQLWRMIGVKMSFGPVTPALALRFALIKATLCGMSGDDSKSA